MLDCLVVEDVGRIVNPLTLHGQAIGGMVQGLGGAFLEHLVYDANGQLLSGNLADYLIPTATDFPKIRAIALENHRSPSNPLGVKGAGEGAIIPIGGLMANAVANALASFGAMPNQLSLSPARVWIRREELCGLRIKDLPYPACHSQAKPTPRTRSRGCGRRRPDRFPPWLAGTPAGTGENRPRAAPARGNSRAR